ncbi:hypothetical protein [Streptomyces sp. Ru73]|nr:hypothetical protein [Streptomyces sp. Ru73]
MPKAAASTAARLKFTDRKVNQDSRVVGPIMTGAQRVLLLDPGLPHRRG